METTPGRDGSLGLGPRAGAPSRALAALAAAPRWPSGDPRAIGLATACMVVALSPLALPGDGDFEGAHLVLLLLLGVAGMRLRFPLAMATAIASEAALAAQRVVASEVARETVMAVAWTILGPAVVAGAFALSEAPRRRVRAAADAAVHSMLRALAAKDGAAGDHSGTVADLAVLVGRDLGVAGDQLADLRAVACMHDVGKLAVPQEVLDKPGPLSPREWELMRRHPEAGAEIAAEIPSLAHLAPILVAVHERWDGDGYPYGLAGERIPLLARIVFCCDAYEAVTAERPYDAARSPREGRRGAARGSRHAVRPRGRRRVRRRARRAGARPVPIRRGRGGDGHRDRGRATPRPHGLSASRGGRALRPWCASAPTGRRSASRRSRSRRTPRGGSPRRP